MRPIGPKPLTAAQVITLMIATVGFVALADAALNMPPEHAYHFKPLPPVSFPQPKPHTGREAIAYLFAAPYDDAGYTVAEYKAKQRQAVRVLREKDETHAKPSMWAALDGGDRE